MKEKKKELENTEEPVQEASKRNTVETTEIHISKKEIKTSDLISMLKLLAILLFIAVVVGMLPQLFGNRSGVGPVVNNTTTIKDGTDINPNLTNLTEINTSASVQKIQCNKSILPSNEKDSYSYLLKYNYSGLEAQAFLMTSVFSNSSEGFIRRVVTNMPIGDMELVMYLDESMNCKRATINIISGNQTQLQETACSSGDDKLEICAEDVNKISEEKIIVKAGEFDTSVYQSLDNSTKFWVANTSIVSVPVKIIIDDVIMELVDYKKWQ